MSFPPPVLIPQPRSIKPDPAGRTHALKTHALPQKPGENGQGHAHEHSPEDFPEAVEFRHAPRLGPEAYRIEITPKRLVLSCSSERGAHYASLTLSQIISQYGPVIPCMVIDDAPDYPNRGYMLDVSRGRVPTLDSLMDLVDLLSSLKYNHLELYVEHVYAFKKHPLLGRGHSPLTARDIRKLDEYCTRRHIELTPNLQSFGHHWHTLRHPRYKGLAESDFRGGWTLCPIDPGTPKLLGELYDEFLPNFKGTRNFNVGCDETWDLCKGRSAELAARIGKGRVYLSHLLRVHELARARGRRMMFWGDIIEHYPELLGELPKDVIVLNWGYEAHGEERGYAKRLSPAAKSGLEHWVCPGTSSWNSLFFRMTNARANLRGMAREGLRAGASGYLVTDWGDYNHYNLPGWSLWPIAYGADCAWRSEPDAPAEKAFDARFASLIMNDDEGRFIEPLRLLGDLYLTFGKMKQNNSAERWLLTGYPDPDILGAEGELVAYNDVTKTALRKALSQAGRAGRLLEKMDTDEEIGAVRDEWALGARLAAHACRRALWHNFGEGEPKALRAEIKSLAADFESAWLRGNRESDLQNNRNDFERIARDYAARKPAPIRFR